MAELGDWVQYELNGYPDEVAVPGYRVMPGVARGHFSGPFGRGVKNAVLPAGNLPEKYRDWARTAYIRQPIAALEKIARNPEGKSLTVMWPGDLVAHVQEDFIEHMVLIQAWLSLDRSQFLAAVEAVRNRILSFALDAEQFVESHGDEAEAEVAGGLANVFHNHIYGPVGNLAQGSTNFTQVANDVGDRDALFAELRKIGVGEERIEELESAMDDDGPVEEERLGKKVAGWIGSTISAAMSGTGKVARETAINVIPRLLQRYYGLE